MNLGKKLGYWRQHLRSITEHDDESLSTRKAILTQMRSDLDDAEAAMEHREAVRLDELLADASDPNVVAQSQVIEAEPAEVAEEH